jgi:endoglucanase
MRRPSFASTSRDNPPLLRAGRGKRRRHAALALIGALSVASLGCDPAITECGSGEQFVKGACVADVKVKLNTVGYRTEGVKRATVEGGTTFDVRRAGDKSVAYSGEVPPLSKSLDTDEDLAVIDFSALTEEGEFYLDVPGQGKSSSFRIGARVFEEPLRVSLLGLYGQRCGQRVEFKHDDVRFEHGVCHTEDALLDYVDPTKKGEVRPSPGGWHDAGDYGKYAVNGAFALGVMLKAWEHFQPALEGLSLEYLPEHGGTIPDFLAEAKFQMDWVLTLQFEDGRVAHKVSGLAFEDLSVPPTADLKARYYSEFSTAAAADFVAVAAQSARVFRPYDEAYADRCLEAARRSWQYLVENPSPVAAPQGSFANMQYNTGDSDDRFWAAAELWETTADADVLAFVEEKPWSVPPNWDWGDVASLGVFTYVLSRHGADPGADPRDPALLQKSIDSVIGSGNALVLNTDRHAYGRGIGDMYYWGINGVVARSTMNLHVATLLVTDEADKARYRDAAVQQIDHILGRNYYARSQITGVGHKPPYRPHHRPSVAMGVAWPGLLIGGSNTPSNDAPLTAAATSWVDDWSDYRTNEVAINWSTAAAYAFAMFL